MKKHIVPLLIVLFLWTTVAVQADGWKIVEGKITTDFAKDVDPKNPLPEYPRPQMVRDAWLNLNGLWDYAITAKDDKFEKSDGKILVPYPIESALSGVGKTVGKDKTLWYQTKFAVPKGKAWDGNRVLLHFGAVDWDTTVFVNGKEVGKHVGGYAPFCFDVTDALKSEGDQEILVKVWDPTNDSFQPIGKQHNNPHGIWYTPVTGIWATVWLEAVPATAIEKLKMTPNIKDGTLTLETTVKGLQDGDVVEAKASFETQSLQSSYRRGPFGRRVAARRAQTKTAQAASVQGKADEKLVLKIDNPKLWTPDTPFLYDLEVTVIRDGKAIDTVDSYFGMREVSLGKTEDGITRMMLNGKFVWQHGPLDQGWWPDGLYTAPTDAALLYDIEVTKKLGYNMLRKHVKVEPMRFYYHCDRLGMLVWQDMPSGDPKHYIKPNAKEDANRSPEAKANFEREWKEIMDTLYNVPSIVVWVPFNEGWGQFDTCRILDLTKKWDPTRLVDGPSGWTDRGCGDMYDMHKYRGPGMFPPEEKRATVLGEYGGLGLPIPGHTWLETDKNWGYGGNLKDKDDLLKTYNDLNRKMHPMIGKGLSAAVYTQTTDVEVEVNGLLTYDRKIIKVDVAKFKASNDALRYPAPERKTLLTGAPDGEKEWAYTIDKPADGWEKADFDDKAWKRGKSGFGATDTPNTTVRTEWKTSDIWVRTDFELSTDDAGKASELIFEMFHDEDAEVYINGVKVLTTEKWNGGYSEFKLTDAAKAFKAGKNVIAIHCKQTSGGQYIDARIYRIVPVKGPKQMIW